MSNENPTSSREVFDENEAGIAQKKQELTDAVAAGDYGKVAELAQEAKSMETAKVEMMGNAQEEALEINKGIDEAKAAEEKAGREAALAEQAKLDAEKSQKEAAEILEKLKGGNVQPPAMEKTESMTVDKEEPVVAENKEQGEKSPEEKMDDYIARFKKLGGKAGDYNLMFQTMRDDKAIDFLNNDAMILRYVKGMGNPGALSPLLAYDRGKVYSKNIVLEIINSMPINDEYDHDSGGYSYLRNLAERSNLAEDKDVVEAIVRKNRFMAYSLFSSGIEDGRKATEKIIKDGPDAYFEDKDWYNNPKIKLALKHY
ncbi:MAG: hypothetical protein NTU85_01025 [Candidatus Kaiserbacteria bacterium]|nr:hypothetical protein [Candidatus Kaiserbacteria bacterium]